MEPAVFAAIVADISAGEAAYKVLAAHGVPRKAFYGYLALDEVAGNRYARAKFDGLERLADESMEIADEQPPTMVLADGDSVSVKLDSGFVAWQRNRIDTRKWLLSKLAPKKYGDKVTQEHTGEGGGAIEMKVTVEFVNANPPPERV